METVYERQNKRDGLTVFVTHADGKYIVTMTDTSSGLVLTTRDFLDRKEAIAYARWFIA